MSVKLVQQKDGSLLLAVKVTPGSSRDRVIGPHGEALKLATSAPPEAGKANRAICKLLADALGLPARNVEVHSGGGSPFKQVRIVGATADRVRAALPLE